MTGEPVAHTDSRPMQPLPWKQEKPELNKCISFQSHNGKEICSFWGGNTRHPQDFQWCTAQQMQNHANYAEHALNNYPLLQKLLEDVYNTPGMPAEAINAIDEAMPKLYCQEVPPYAGK